MKNVFITTLGCKVNQFESAAFKTGFADRGMTAVKDVGAADIIVINTCAVTARAGAQSRQVIRQALRQNHSADIIVTGCYAEIAANELSKEKELQGRAYKIIGNSEKDSLVAEATGNAARGQQILLGSIADAKDICRLPVRRFGERSRAYLRVQDGCESFCTYCIVPYTRGPSRSLPLKEVVEQAKIFALEGHKEIVLTGIHLGYYGKDLPEESNLLTLLEKLTEATPETYYRVSSLEPQEISVSLLSLMRERKTIQPHLHIPLQSGSDEILGKMNRRYTTHQFRTVVELCHHHLPDCAIGIDVLAGFPGESDLLFSKAKNFLQSLDFSYLHVFPYSIRPGTVAATFREQVPKKVKDLRVKELMSISDEKKKVFYQSQIAQIRKVLVEGQRDKKGRLKGFTDNYIDVRFEGPDSLLASITLVKLISVDNHIALGARKLLHEN